MKADWCIVRWQDGELMVVREYQWEPHSDRFNIWRKWEYVAKGVASNEQAIDWVRKYSQLLKE